MTHPFTPHTPSLRVLLVGLALAALAVPVRPALACEKHLDGHQTSAQTQAEVQGQR